MGSSTRQAKEDYIEDLTREAQRFSYDEELIHTSKDMLSKHLLKDLYHSKITNRRLITDKIIGQKPANKESYFPTVAGILMFSEVPHEYIPEALIKCTRFKGLEGRDIVRSEDITGSIEQQSRACEKLLKAWMATDYILQGPKLVGQLPVPIVALREAILNALLHRKYNIPGATKIAIFDNRIEIFSPGCFPGLVGINNLGDGTTFLRNPTLARLAYQMELIETRGTGIRLIYKSCKDAGIRKPEYHEEGDFVKVVFFFEPDKDQFSNEEESIVALVKKYGEVTAAQVAGYLSVSRNSALRKLNVVIKRGIIRKSGKGPSVVYKEK